MVYYRKIGNVKPNGFIFTKGVVMTKVDMKKNKKRQDILDAAYELFTTKGFSSTTIMNIALKAGVGKGTFYLYFDSKEAVRDELIVIKASRILTKAVNAMEESLGANRKVGVADRFIFVADFILNYLSKDLTLLRFVSKNLSWGLFLNSRIEEKNSDVINFKDFISLLIERDHVHLKNPDILIYTLIEMVNSTCYSVLINEDPVSFEEYKPYLYHCIRLLIDDAREN